MASRFMTDPHAMRDMAGRFEVHAQTVEDEARRMWALAVAATAAPVAAAGPAACGGDGGPDPTAAPVPVRPVVTAATPS